MSFKKTLFVFFSLITISLPLSATAVTRAAFDLGSGKFKVLVAVVDGDQVEVKFSKMVDIKLGEDFAASSDGCLSQQIQTKALEILQDLKLEALKNGAVEFRGITTAVFRKAKNGEAFLNLLREKTGISLTTISQEKEGMIGFNTARILSPEFNANNILSWDSGNASFQITSNENVYEGPYGNSLVSKAFIEEVRHLPFTKNASINPVSLEEAEKLSTIIQSKITQPQWLKEKLAQSETEVIGIGDEGSIFAMGAKGLNKTCYTRDEVLQVIEKLAGLENCDLTSYRKDDPETVITRLILLYSVMNKFGIEKVTFKESTGSTLGLMIDPDFWN